MPLLTRRYINKYAEVHIVLMYGSMVTYIYYVYTYAYMIIHACMRVYLFLSPGLWVQGLYPLHRALVRPRQLRRTESCMQPRQAGTQNGKRLPSATALRSIDKHIKKVHDEVPETKSSNKEEGHQKWPLCKPRKASAEQVTRFQLGLRTTKMRRLRSSGMSGKRGQGARAGQLDRIWAGSSGPSLWYKPRKDARLLRKIHAVRIEREARYKST